MEFLGRVPCRRRPGKVGEQGGNSSLQVQSVKVIKNDSKSIQEGKEPHGCIKRPESSLKFLFNAMEEDIHKGFNEFINFNAGDLFPVHQLLAV